MAGEFLSFLGRGVSKFGQNVADGNELRARQEQQQAEMAALQEERMFNREWKNKQDAQEAEAIQRQQIKDMLDTLGSQENNTLEDPELIAQAQKYAPGRLQPDTVGNAAAGGLGQRFKVLRSTPQQQYFNEEGDKDKLSELFAGLDWKDPNAIVGGLGQAAAVNPRYGQDAASLARELYSQQQANSRESQGNATQLEAARINASGRQQPQTRLDPNQENTQWQWRQQYEQRMRQEAAIPAIATKTLNENPRMAVKSGTPEYMTALQALIAQMKQSLPAMPDAPRF